MIIIQDHRILLEVEGALVNKKEVKDLHQGRKLVAKKGIEK